MSESTPTESSAPKNQGSSKRLVILLGVLGVGLLGLGYDRVVARPAVSKAYESLLAENEKVNAENVLTDEKVRELLGRSPAETFEDTNGDTVERYSWRAGMPIKTHDLFVVYKPQAGKMMFHRVDKFVFESGGQVSKFDTGTAIVVEGGDGEGPIATVGGGGGAGRPDAEDGDEPEEGETEGGETEGGETEGDAPTEGANNVETGDAEDAGDAAPESEGEPEPAEESAGAGETEGETATEESSAGSEGDGEAESASETEGDAKEGNGNEDE